MRIAFQKAGNRISRAYWDLRNRNLMRMAGVKTENGDHLLEVLGTIIIAVVILVFFRSQIVDLFNTAIRSTTEKTNNLFTDVG